MVRLREVPRTAAFAWSPGTSTPLLATGTKAGAVDADFSNETQLELWDLHLETTSAQELQPVGRIDTDSRFHDIAWVESPDRYSKGIIAGALESGALDIWDAQKLFDGESPFISRTTKHSGAIKALQFNPVKRELLATAGAKGELFVSDLENVGSPFRLGNTAARADDFECIDWNKKVSHIMVTGSSGGFVTVWDVKMKKESLTLNNYGRKPVGAVAWDPEKILRGHDGGVLSLSWCSQDNDLLLSCGKDNKTICWNTQTGDPYGEFPVVTNWTFQTEWNPCNPGMLATASFDGKIAIHTLQSTRMDNVQSSQAPPLDGEDFFNRARSEPQVSSFSLPRAPKWLKRPIGASFGFAGKLVTFHPREDPKPSYQLSEIRISDFEVDPEVSTMTTSFMEAIQNKDLAAICASRVSQSKADTERGDWKVIETLIARNPRKELLSYLGFEKSTANAAVGKQSSHLDVAASGASPDPGKNGTLTTKNNRLSAYFEGNADGENFLADLASTKGAKTNNPFQIYADDEPETDKSITQALMLGDFDQAMELSLQEGRLSDAFMIALCGGQSSIDKVQKAYFQKQASGPKYLRLLASIVGKNLWDVVYNADLQNWKEVMATLCTYASSEDFPDLCEALGDRLEDQSAHAVGRNDRQRNASFCYLAGSKLEKVVDVWIGDMELLEREQSDNNKKVSEFAVHARALQSLIEKVTVFREATQYQDKELRGNSDWRLEPLYQKYVEYADIVASNGHLEVAETYLKLLPEKYLVGSIARNRVSEATRKAVIPRPDFYAIGANQKTPARHLPAVTDPRTHMYSQPPKPHTHQPAPQPQLSYAPQAPPVPGAPGNQVPQQAPASRPIVPPPPSFGAHAQGPPRTMNISPSVAPSRAPSTTTWNDTPEDFFKPPTSRRGTPAAQSMPAGATSQTQPIPPGGLNIGIQSGSSLPRGPPPVAPPPKGPAPPPRSMTPQNQQVHSQPERPPSVAANTYAPAQYPGEISHQSQVPRGKSPYNAPPSTAPRDLANRYTPTLATQQQAPSGPNQRPPPPSNAFLSRPGPSEPQDVASRMEGPSGYSTRPSQGQLPEAGLSSPPQQQQQQQQPQPRQQQPLSPPLSSPPRYPPGDRSHIPDIARLVYEIFNDELQRVKPFAPANYRNHVIDAEKRLNILFDHLNNETLLKPNTVSDMAKLAQALRARDHQKAENIQLDIITNRTDECTNWMPGVKRLITMSKATPL